MRPRLQPFAQAGAALFGLARDLRHRFDYPSRCQATRVVPAGISFETVSRCNGHCAFCSIGSFPERREKASLSAEVIRKVCLDLRHFGFSGRVYMNNNNEPLLDPDILEKCRVVRETLPGAYVILHTNGKLLTDEKLWDLSPYVNIVSVGWYEEGALPFKPNAKTLVTRVPWDAVRNTRGGTAPNRLIRPRMYAPCKVPFEEAYVLADGRLALCCCDVWGKYPLGDVNETPFRDLWRGVEYEGLRALLGKSRSNLAGCNICDAN